MSGTNRLGPAVSKRRIALAVVGLAQTWASTYLADAERQEGVAAGTLERPRDYERIVTLSKWPEVQVPAVLVIVSGVLEEPSRRGNGELLGVWDVGVFGLVHGRSADDGDLAESIYGAAIRQMMLNQTADLAGITVAGVRQVTESYDDLPVRRGRSVRGALLGFALTVRHHASAGNRLASPPVPPIGDPGPYPTADTVTVTLEKTPN